MELDCLRTGYEEYCKVRGELNLPLLETGAMVVAWSKEEEDHLESIRAGAIANGVDDVALPTARQTLVLEPNLNPALAAALLVPQRPMTVGTAPERSQR